jgi:hypothetical protein
VTSLRELVGAGLRRGHTLVEVDRWLVWIQRTLLPRGSASRRGDLEDLMPDGYLATLENADPLHVRLLSPHLLAPTIVCCVLAGLLPASLSPAAGIVGAIVAATAAVLAGGRVVTARDHQRLRPGPARRGGGPAERRMPVPTESRDGDFWSFGVLAFVAGLGGAALGAALLGPALGTPPVAVAAALSVGVVAGAVTMLVRVLWRGWERAAAQWVDGVAVRSASRRLADVRDLVEEVALNDWLLADPRRQASDLASALHDAVTGIIEAIEVYADDLSERPAGDRAHAAPGISVEVSDQLRRHGKELAALFRQDLVDVAWAVLSRGFDELERGALETMAEWVGDYTRYLLLAYDEHLGRMGVHGVLPFGGSGEGRRALAASVWKESPHVASLLRSRVTDTDILQLVGGNHVMFLDPSPARACLVPFLPRASRPTHDRTTPLPAPAAVGPETLGDVVWTEWGQVAGVLRLAALTHGAVETIQEQQP